MEKKFQQLFRRVAAALPGMDTPDHKPPEDSILFPKNETKCLCLSLLYLLFISGVLYITYIL